MSYKIQKNILFNENCIITLNRFENQSIDGVITSPPYNINTERSDCYYNHGYSELDSLNEKDYIDTRTEEFFELSRVIRNKGVICYNISYAKENPILPTLLISNIHNKTDLTVADIICWKKSHSIPFQTSPTKLSRITELIYIIVKKEFINTFDTNKTISKINNTTNQKFYNNYTNYVEASNNDGYKCNFKAAYSTELVNKIINIYFKPGSVIYDPFSGIGTTQLGCIENDCYYIGSEILKYQYDIAISRIKQKHIDKENNSIQIFKNL